MSPEERLQKAFELSELVKILFLQGLKQRFPEKSEKEIHEIYVKRTIQIANTESLEKIKKIGKPNLTSTS